MCNCYDGDAPAYFVQKIRKARKDHNCIECGKIIKSGQKYEHISGLWDGRPDSFSTCLPCVILKQAHIKAEEAVQTAEWEANGKRGWVEPCNPIIGDIRNAIGECARYEPAYVAEFRRARRELFASSLEKQGSNETR